MFKSDVKPKQTNEKKTHLAVLPDKRETGVHAPLEQDLDVLGILFGENLGQTLYPGLHDGAPPQGGGLQVDHATPTHSGRLKKYISLLILQ